MMADLVKNFDFVLDLTGKHLLSISNLFATVIVSKGESGKATVEMKGDERLLNLFEASQTGPEGFTVFGKKVPLSIKWLKNGSVNTYTFSDRSGHSGPTIEITQLPTVTITIPEGTDLDVSDVRNFGMKGINGKLDLSLGIQCLAEIEDVLGVIAKCGNQSHVTFKNVNGDMDFSLSNQSTVNVEKSQGNLEVSCSTQSHAFVQGSFGDVDAEASTQSSVSITGDCRDFKGKASTMSRVVLAGTPSGKVKVHESTMSSVSFK